MVMHANAMPPTKPVLDRRIQYFKPRFNDRLSYLYKFTQHPSRSTPEGCEGGCVGQPFAYEGNACLPDYTRASACCEKSLYLLIGG
jgi:hypothetical protein